VREEVARKNSLWRFEAKRHFSPAPFGGEAQGPPSRLPQAQNETDQERRTLAVWSEATEKNEKAVRQPDGLFFQGRIVPTVIRKSHQNFLAKILRAVERQCQEIFK